MYPEGMQHQALWTLSFDLEGFQILALLIYCSVIRYSSQTRAGHGCQIEVSLSPQQNQCKIPMNQIQHVFYGKITSNSKLLFTQGWKIIKILIYKYLTYFSFGQLRIIIIVSKRAEKIKILSSLSSFQVLNVLGIPQYFKMSANSLQVHINLF